jgi:hypothetical protein
LLFILLTTLPPGCNQRSADPGTTPPPAPTWSEFAHVAGRFKIDMPGKPKEEVYTSQTNQGEVKLVSNLLQLPDRRTFSVTFLDYPQDPKFANQQGVQETLDEAVVNVGKEMRGRVEKRQTIELGQHPGREFTVVLVDSGEMLLGRIYLVKNRLYQVFSGWSEARGETAADAERFVKSFRLAQ